MCCLGSDLCFCDRQATLKEGASVVDVVVGKCFGVVDGLELDSS